MASRMIAVLTLLRPHQWVKNVLLFLAMIAAHRFDLATLVPILWGIVAFSAAASSIYIVNDLISAFEIFKVMPVNIATQIALKYSSLQ